MTLIHKIISQVNDESKVILTKGKNIEWSEIRDAIKKKQDKYTMMYGKHFYGFEKEGKSSYYSEKQIDNGIYVKLSFPLSHNLIKNDKGGILNVFLNAIWHPWDLFNKVQKLDESEDDGKENI